MRIFDIKEEKIVVHHCKRYLLANFFFSPISDVWSLYEGTRRIRQRRSQKVKQKKKRSATSRRVAEQISGEMRDEIRHSRRVHMEAHICQVGRGLGVLGATWDHHGDHQLLHGQRNQYHRT